VSPTEVRNTARLCRLRAAIDKENPVDAIHNPVVAGFYSEGGECPRFLGCTSEGHWDSAYRTNPDFFVGPAEKLINWLADSYEEGWAGRWVLDLESGEHIGWKTSVELTGGHDGS
jgi:hypothetical protein